MTKGPLLSKTQGASIERLYELYPQLLDQSNSEWTSIVSRAQVMSVPSCAMLAAAGSECTSFMLLLDGSVRVYQHTEDGREATLYRISPGDVCLMTLNSLIHNKPFKANAQSETDVNMILFGTSDFYKALAVSDAFRMLIFTSLVDTVCDMVQSFYDTTFEPLDMRLACLLGRLFERSDSDTLNITHQELSQELGTTREVISRLLKKLEQQECIILKRGQILLADIRKLPGIG
jgi:CRP/FNR family transcriptional regulator